MSDNLRVGAWASIDAGCPIKYTIPFDGVVSVSFGDVFDLTFDDESMRELAQLAAAVVQDIADRGKGVNQSATTGGGTNS